LKDEEKKCSCFYEN